MHLAETIKDSLLVSNTFLSKRQFLRNVILFSSVITHTISFYFFPFWFWRMCISISECYRITILYEVCSYDSPSYVLHCLTITRDSSSCFSRRYKTFNVRLMSSAHYKSAVLAISPSWLVYYVIVYLTVPTKGLASSVFNYSTTNAHPFDYSSPIKALVCMQPFASINLFLGFFPTVRNVSCIIDISSTNTNP